MRVRACVCVCVCVCARVVTIETPVNVQLSPSKFIVCENETMSFKRSSDSNPAVDSYELFENDTLGKDDHSSGVWKRKMASWRVFFHRCVVKNAMGHDRTENVCTVSTSCCPIQSLRKVF